MNIPYTNPMMREGTLSGKVIIITGGGTGLGRAMGEYFLELGASLVITSRKLPVLEKAAGEMKEKKGGVILPIACDVRNEEEVNQMLQKTIEKFGKVDILINNAAGNFISPTERLSSNAFSTIIDIVLKGSVNCTLAIGKHWIGTKHPGTVLNILTTYAWTGSGYVVPSACAKAGVLAMTRSLAVEWAKYNIRLNGIAPGPFPTKGAWDRLLPGDLKDKLDMAQKIPLKRLGNHQELANLAAYLISDYSAYINGEIITIDGGEWLQGAGQFNILSRIPLETWNILEEVIRKNR